MPEIPDVVPGAPVESTWGNLMRNRAVMRYADDAARTASDPAPADGQLSYLEDSDMLEVRAAGVWVPVVVLVGGQTIEDEFGNPRIEFTGTGHLQLSDEFERRISILAAGDILIRDAASDAVFSWDESQRVFVMESGRFQIAQAGGTELRLKNSSETIVDGEPLGSVDFWSDDASSGGEGVQGFVRSLSSGGSGRQADLSLGAGGSPTPPERVRLLGAGGVEITGIANFLPAQYLRLAAGIRFEMEPEETGSAASAHWVNTGGSVYHLRRSTSARKYKKKIRKLFTRDRRKFIDADLPTPVEFTHKGDETEYIGFIADDLAELDPRLGVYDDDGEIDNYDLRGVVAILAAQVTDLRERVAALESP